MQRRGNITEVLRSRKQRTRSEQIEGAEDWENGERCLKDENVERCVASKRLRTGTKTGSEKRKLD